MRGHAQPRSLDFATPIQCRGVTLPLDAPAVTLRHHMPACCTLSARLRTRISTSSASSSFARTCACHSDLWLPAAGRMPWQCCAGDPEGRWPGLPTKPGRAPLWPLWHCRARGLHRGQRQVAARHKKWCWCPQLAPADDRPSTPPLSPCLLGEASVPDFKASRGVPNHSARHPCASAASRRRSARPQPAARASLWHALS